MDWNEIRESLLSGMSAKAAGALYGMRPETIRNKSSAEGWEIREGREAILREAAEGKEVGLAVAVEQSAVQEHRESMLALSMASRRSLAEAIRKGMNYLSGLPEAELAKQHQVVATFVSAGEALFGWKALAAVEAEAAVRTVREESGLKDQRAINLELIRVKPEELRERARAKAAEEGRAPREVALLRKAAQAKAVAEREVEGSPVESAEG